MTVLSPEQMSHVCQRTGEMFIGNMTLTEFNALPYGAHATRQDAMAFDENELIIHKGRQFPEQRKYPTFVLRSAVEAERRMNSGLPA